MPLVKRESIKVRRGYGKPVLERKQNWEEKEKNTDFDMKGFMKEMSDATKEFKL